MFTEYGIPYQIDLGGGVVPEHLRERAQPASAAVALIRGDIAHGTVFPEAGLVIFGAEDLFDSPETAAKPIRLSAGAFSADQFDLKAGRLRGSCRSMESGSFWASAKSRRAIPKATTCCSNTRAATSSMCRWRAWIWCSAFAARAKSKPQLDRMGGATWTRTKTRIKTKMRDMAEELLKLYAQRKMAKGFSFSADSNWQREFEDAFEFTETRDQKTAIADIKRDMESPQPMDRLLCGDVGYGKTEVVMRAAFKALGDGKQVAVLAPTTVLCFQHFETFKKALPVVSRAHGNVQPVPQRRRRSRRRWKIWRKAKWISRSARTGCFRKTWCGKIWAW